jgi:crotonobetainyl-CoA:carnitine CoA-transferase CaiB-like acyl-CoA transferase
LRPAIEAWASGRTKLDVALELGRSGIAAGPVHTNAEVVADSHLRARHMIVEMERTDGVDRPVLSPGIPVKLSKVPEAPSSRIPWCGEHTEEILVMELGCSSEEVDALVADGVVGTDPSN